MPPKVPLEKAPCWVRIRPIGTHGHTDGQAVEKQLGEFDDSAVTIVSHDQSGAQKRYDYMSKVFPVDCTQKNVADEILPPLLEDFWDRKSAMIFAYGQTGTGKTHTMFGVQESLSQAAENDGWGLLPRAVHLTLAKIEERKAMGINSVLLLSAVEFYCFQAYDLADKAEKQMCTMRGAQVIGNSYQQCESPATLAEFLTRVYGNRNVAATKMNDGSSRSHCAITLTLLTADTSTADSLFTHTTFSIVDLAGAERPEKATGSRITKEQALMQLYAWFKKGMQGKLSAELQGYLINCELMGLCDNVVYATDLQKHGKKFPVKAQFLGGSATSFLAGGLAGECRIGSLVCLSQSPQNGWETWFSIAQYGAKLAALKTRIDTAPAVPLKKALAAAEKACADAASEVANQKNTPSAMKYAAFRRGMKVYTEQLLYFMKVLDGSNGSSGSGNGGNTVSIVAATPAGSAGDQPGGKSSDGTTEEAEPGGEGPVNDADGVRLGGISSSSPTSAT